MTDAITQRLDRLEDENRKLKDDVARLVDPPDPPKRKPLPVPFDPTANINAWTPREVMQRIADVANATMPAVLSDHRRRPLAERSRP